jgi:hypothetical protein
MGQVRKDSNPLQEAMESGLRMQLEWGAPMALLEAGAFQVHVVDEGDGHRWCLEVTHRFAPPLAQGVCRRRSDAVCDAARALLAALAPPAASNVSDRGPRRTRRAPAPGWWNHQAG